MLRPLLLNAHNPSPMTGSGNNTYLIVGADRTAALIDAGVGHPRHLDEIAAALSERGAQLTLVLVTHDHLDHIGGAAALRAAHPGAAFAKLPRVVPASQAHVPFQPLRDGALVTAGGEGLTVVHTPGHSPDHIAFWHEPTRTLFTGDLVALGSSVMIDTGRGGSLVEYMASLERVLAMAPARLLPAHGEIIDDPPAVLRAYLEHRRMRERQVMAALKAGRCTVQAIAESIYDDLNPALMPAARQNVRAHLEKLRDEGQVVNDHDRWSL